MKPNEKPDNKDPKQEGQHRKKQDVILNTLDNRTKPFEKSSFDHGGFSFP